LHGFGCVVGMGEIGKKNSPAASQPISKTPTQKQHQQLGWFYFFTAL
jgi:hypothetical protein